MRFKILVALFAALASALPVQQDPTAIITNTTSSMASTEATLSSATIKAPIPIDEIREKKQLKHIFWRLVPCVFERAYGENLTFVNVMKDTLSFNMANRMPAKECLSPKDLRCLIGDAWYIEELSVDERGCMVPLDQVEAEQERAWAASAQLE